MLTVEPRADFKLTGITSLKDGPAQMILCPSLPKVDRWVSEIVNHFSEVGKNF